MERLAGLAGRCERFIPLTEVRLLAPLPNPPKLLGLAVNYLEHHREIDRGRDFPDDPKRTTTPRPFLMPSTTVAGPGDEIPWPATSRQIDYEVELAVVIGRKAKNVSPQAAGGYIAGYTIANDVSARSATFAEGRAKREKDEFFDWLHGKWPDGFCPMGPWLVTPEEVGDARDLELELTVNGKTRQKASTSMMIFDVFEVVSFCSHLMTLLPGDVIATGTPSGVAAATGKYLRGGDVITCRIECIGELTNTLGREPESYYTPCRT
jgi:2-keto-4-pentenoate hydratase/2-oxohepta-3-ene-1,7-dioic acid hydratase in catechol pathway